MVVHDTFEEYKAKKGYVNPSSFKGDKTKTPAKFIWDYEHPENKETQSMKLGTALHCKILTPELFDGEYYLATAKEFPGAVNKDGSPSMMNKENKETLAVLKAEHPNKIILFPGDVETLNGMLAGINRFIFPEWQYNLSRKHGVVETSLYYCAKFDLNFNFIEFCEDPLNYVPLDPVELPFYEHEGFYYLRIKTRSDYFSQKKTYASDVKTTQCAEPESFSKDIYEYGYHGQAAFTMDVLTAMFEAGCKDVNRAGYSHFYFVVVENQPPYHAIIFELAQNAIKRGRQSYENRLSYICKGYATGTWPGYEMYSDSMSFDEDGNIIQNYKVIEIDLPYWAYSKEERKQKHEEVRAF